MNNRGFLLPKTDPKKLRDKIKWGLLPAGEVSVKLSLYSLEKTPEVLKTSGVSDHLKF